MSLFSSYVILLSFILIIYIVPPTTVFYTLSLHDALPSSPGRGASGPALRRPSPRRTRRGPPGRDRKSTRLNSSHLGISYAVLCLKKKKQNDTRDKNQ